MGIRPVYFTYRRGGRPPVSSSDAIELARSTAEEHRKSIPEKSIAFRLLKAYIMEQTILHSVVDADYMTDPDLWTKKFEKVSLFCVLKKKKRSCRSSVCVI